MNAGINELAVDEVVQTRHAIDEFLVDLPPEAHLHLGYDVLGAGQFLVDLFVVLAKNGFPALGGVPNRTVVEHQMELLRTGLHDAVAEVVVWGFHTHLTRGIGLQDGRIKQISRAKPA